MRSIIVHGSQGCGKTSAAQALRRHFGCTQIIDEWDGRVPLPGGALVMTNLPPHRFRAPANASVIEFARALRLL